jgi:hypothetical protein
MPQDERDYIIEKTRKHYEAWLNSSHTQEEALDRAYYDPKEFRNGNTARAKAKTSVIVNWLFVIVLATSITAAVVHQNKDLSQKVRKILNESVAEFEYKIGKTLAEGGWGSISRNSVEAAKWYKESATLGNREAQYSLGKMYSHGQGVLQDHAEALRWYRLSAEQGHANAQGELGTMYANGQSVAKNNNLAHMWLNLAAANGSSAAEKNRDLIAARMSQKQIAETQRLAKECQARDYKNCE